MIITYNYLYDDVNEGIYIQKNWIFGYAYHGAQDTGTFTGVKVSVVIRPICMIIIIFLSNRHMYKTEYAQAYTSKYTY